MIIYSSTKQAFINEVQQNTIVQTLDNEIFKKMGMYVSPSEEESWKVSLRYMRDVLNVNDIPDDSGVALEYVLPQTSKRIDFIITGKNQEDVDHMVIIELKQWSKAGLSEKDGILNVAFYDGEVNHPSYQAWSYAALLNGFNETIEQENIQLKPCAYLHNYIPDDVIANPVYQSYLDQAPVFLQGDDEKQKLRDFITSFVRKGDNGELLYRVDNGKIRPTKSLTDALAKMMKGNKEFVMIDDQKIVYETAKHLAIKSTESSKNVYIVRGGPGTGKSVVAVNLLVDLLKAGLNSRYVSKNAAPRAVFESRLTGTMKRTEYGNLFTGSGKFVGIKENTFDVLLVDEAHRLNEKSGLYGNLGENQIKEIMQASKCSVFFIDEDQRVTWNDIGDSAAIEKWAHDLGINVTKGSLASQFRCNGSDGYLAWLDDVLHIHETANYTFDRGSYDFKVFDSPTDLREVITEKNADRNRARMVAGYCWDWKSRSDKNAYDLKIPEYGFEMKWNLVADGSTWLIAEKSVNEIGCIHTCQGLELDYVGVIVGDDLVVRNGIIVTNPNKRAKTDISLRGFSALSLKDPESAKKKADSIIKNTYRTLMTRGMRGCYVYFTDKETSDYFKNRLNIV